MSRIVAGGLLLLMSATWRLWTPQTIFPRVPFFGVLRGLPDWCQWSALVLAATGLVVVFLAGVSRRSGRWAILAAIASLAILIAADQHRLQPWAYEYWLLMLILASLPAGEAVAWSRLLVVSIYFYSAVSKLNWSFIESGGGVIVDGLLTSLNLAGESVSLQQRQILAGLLPVAELLVATGLCWSRSRKIALAGSIVMHLLLLAALGRWGADQKPGVLIWNALFVVQNMVLFGLAGERTMHAGVVTNGESAKTSFGMRSLRAGVRSLLTLAVLFPLTEPFGLCDVWPAWAVYATAGERARVYIREEDRARLPAHLQQFAEGPRFIDGRCLVRIDRWSLDVLQAPVYPQNRFRLGVAFALAAGLENKLHVEIDSAAARCTGARSTKELTGAAEIVSELDNDWLNGLPET